MLVFGLQRAGLLLLTALTATVTTMTACADPAGPYPDKANLMVYRDAAAQPHPVRSPADWQVRRAAILERMQQVMGPLPPHDPRLALDMQVAETVQTPAFTRLRISYVAEPGDRVPAYLLLPAARAGRVPAMLCLHQTTAIGKGEPAGLGGLENLHYAQELAARGYVALAPDYPNFGDYRYDAYAHGYVSATMKGIVNHRRAVDLLQSLPEVDPARIGCLGHSLGGHNTLFVAAFDERIRVAVSSCGFTAFPRYMGGDLHGWSHAGYMPRILELYAADPARMPFDFTEVLGALAPRPVFINAPRGDDNFDVGGVDECVAAARPVYRLLGAEQALVCRHPDCAHDFPAAVREEAYRFVAAALAR